jgi:hypothetical protein
MIVYDTKKRNNPYGMITSLRQRLERRQKIRYMPELQGRQEINNISL